MIPTESTPLVFFVNGKKIIEKGINPEWTLLYYLRNKLLLCGTKLGCAEGGCGACTVMLSKYNRKEEKIEHLAINACLAPVCSMHGYAVTTVEGIGSTKTKLHPVQQRIAKAHGSQCGFCTPGFVMSMYTLLRNINKPSMKDLETTFQGNICRCTGYRPIIDGYKTFTKDFELMQNGTDNNGCPMGNNCCKNQNKSEDDEDLQLYKASEFIPYDATQEPIFPPELKLYKTLDEQYVIFKSNEMIWYRPIQLTDLLELKDLHPEAKIIAGNTKLGIETKFKNKLYPILVHPFLIPELTCISATEKGIKIGACVSLENLENTLNSIIPLHPEYKTRSFVTIVRILRWFGNKQIRNVVTLGGNIMVGSPVSDLNPIFIAAGIEVELQSKQNGIRRVTMDENFFLGHGKTIVKNNEVLIAIVIPFTEENQFIYAYKQARRRICDGAIVNCGFNIKFKPSTHVISEINLLFGGMGVTIIKPEKTCKTLINRTWNQETLNMALESLSEEMQLSESAPGGMVPFRKSLTLSFFFRFFLTISEQLHIKIKQEDKSALVEFHNETPKSSQYFYISPNDNKMDPVGRPITHLSAFKHATGEAVYCDDMTPYKNELYLAFVLSQRAHARINIDASKALAMEGVHLFLSAKDLSSARNNIGSSKEDFLFVENTVTSPGQILGAIVAEDKATAQKAAHKVKVTYEDLQPVIISIEDAIKHNSYFTEFPNPRILEKGNVDEAFAKAPHVIEGDCRTGAQNHFYLETQAAIAVPKKEDHELEIFCSTQFPSKINELIAHVLDVPQNRIITRVKRVGGAFGGKEHRSAIVAIPAAMAALRLGRPVRCMLDRDEDFVMMGLRHPYYIKFKTAFDDNGKILGSEIHLYNNAGYTNDLSDANMQRAMLHVENAYNIPNIRIYGHVCKTNLQSNVAFRGFGAPQAMLGGEFIIRNIAEYLKKDPTEIAELNLYKEGDVTPYNFTLENCTLVRCWNECKNSSKFNKRQKDIEKYNKENRWKKRGISMVCTKFGVGFGVLCLNQAGALIHVYTDGSVLLSHSGIEVGQGLHTKMIQIASRVLEIPYEKIHINETATDKVPNTPPTSASISSDINGMAVLNACKIINSRLEPFKAAKPKGTWEEWVSQAFLNRVSLSTTGFYKFDTAYDWETNSGKPYDYFTMGVACTEVEIDCLTGDHQILRTDIVMDVGESLNPAIDIGQIEGAFMQGYGLYMLEEFMYSHDGNVLTKGPSSYKLPGYTNIPTEFNVSLLKGAPNPRAIYSSKAVGEPPLFLASSTLFAAREAIKSAREAAGISPTDFKLYAPVSADKIRMACQDYLTDKIQTQSFSNGTGVSWNVIP